MFKKDYMEILYRIENITKQNNKFDYDCVLDGTYNFNVNEVSIVYELLHIIEKITSANDSLICIKQDDTLLKELRFCFNDVVYKVTRLFNSDESTVITKVPPEDKSYFVPEKDLLEHIEEKCQANRKMFGSFYERIKEKE